MHCTCNSCCFTITYCEGYFYFIFYFLQSVEFYTMKKILLLALVIYTLLIRLIWKCASTAMLDCSASYPWVNVEEGS